GLGRSQVVPVRGSFDPPGVDRDQAPSYVLASGGLEQELDDGFRVLVVALPESVMAKLAVSVGEVESRPVLVIESAPDPVVAVDRDRIVDPHLLRRSANMLEIAFDLEFGAVHPDHHEPIVSVLLEPAADVGKRAKPVDAGERPELDEHGLP